jgi:dihydroneopterin aldolase
MNGIIQLEGMEFFSHHGFYDEEQRLGNKYTVNLTIETPLQTAATSDFLHDTVSYEQLYALTHQVMHTPSRLLENVAKRLIDSVYAHYPQVTYCEVSIAKHNPPLGGLCHKAIVTLKQHKA